MVKKELSPAENLPKNNRRGRQVAAWIFGMLIIAVLVYAGIKHRPMGINSGKIQVVASFYPLYDFAKNVGGSYVDVANITPGGAEPHDYEPTPKDIVKIYNARLFILNGNNLDAWGDKLQKDLQTKGVKILRMSDYMEAIKTAASKENNPHDPHFWLDPANAAKEADIIADALIKIDAAHASGYVQNRDNFKKELALLHREYKNGLSECRLKEIVVAHNAFGYLAKRYNFSTLYISGLTPDEEPSPARMAEIIRLAKEKNIKYIFFETLVSPKLAETVASAIGARTLVLNPIEGLAQDDISQGKNYISAMKDNLSNLKIALECR